MSGCRLAGRGVLVTRAAEQAENLCQLIRQHGGRPVPLPAIEIAGPPDPIRLQQFLSRLDSYDMALFISPNAVKWGLRQLPDGLPPDMPVGAVGRSTARALEAAGLPVAIQPEQGYDSEALLKNPLLQQIRGRRILIFRGDGGRPLLAEVLRQRGARVDYAEVYQRRCPRPDVEALLAGWQRDVDLVTATSNQILDNLLLILGPAGRKLLLATPLLVISPRMLRHAGGLGWRQTMLAPGPDDQALLQGICTLFADPAG